MGGAGGGCWCSGQAASLAVRITQKSRLPLCQEGEKKTTFPGIQLQNPALALGLHRIRCGRWPHPRPARCLHVANSAAAWPARRSRRGRAVWNRWLGLRCKYWIRADEPCFDCFAHKANECQQSNPCSQRKAEPDYLQPSMPLVCPRVSHEQQKNGGHSEE